MTNSTDEQSNYWLDVAARDIIERYPDHDELIVSSGISPSASYHIGHYREIMTAEALAWSLRQHGRKARHIHVVDNIDPLRKWYDFLPPAKKDYAGWPVALVPDPIGDCHESYADHFYAEFQESLAPMGIAGEHLTILKSYEDLYRPNHMTQYIEQALEHTAEIKAVFEKLSNRELFDDWTSVWVLGPDHKYQKGELSTWDKNAKTINGLSYENGNAKLDWRLDWPARWAYLGVNVEPFGFQEHGAAGGSYDTGVIFARDVFGVQAPYGDIRYGHIHRPGENIKMSSSKNNVVTPKQALEIMPPEILRYFIVRGKPEKKIFFDPGAGLSNLIDEYAAAQADPNHDFRDAYNFAVAGANQTKTISSVPFKHLVSVYQAARRDVAETLEILARTDYADQVQAERNVITAELVYVENWLNNFAPDNVKFVLQEKLPEVALDEGQVAFLDTLAASVAAFDGNLDGQQMHELIYGARDSAEIKPSEAFQALYKVILGQTFGPKAGWYLASLDKDWLAKRLARKA